MSFLIRTALLAAAVAAGAGMMIRKHRQNQHEGTKIVYLGDDDAVVDADRAPVPATVKVCYRRMDPLSLNAANEAVFLLEDRTEVKLNFSGDGGLYLKAGDCGVLTWRGQRLIRFEKENGDVIGGMFYAPAGEMSDE